MFRRVVTIAASLGIAAGLLAGAPVLAEEQGSSPVLPTQFRDFVDDPDYYVFWLDSDPQFDCDGLYCEITGVALAISKDSPDEATLLASMDRSVDRYIPTSAQGYVAAYIQRPGEGTDDLATFYPETTLNEGAADMYEWGDDAELYLGIGVEARWYRGNDYWAVTIPWRELGLTQARVSMRVVDQAGNMDDAPDPWSELIPFEDALSPDPEPTPPSAPTGVSASVSAAGTVTLEFTPPSGDVIGYGVQAQRDGGSWESVTTSASRADVVVGPDVVNGRNPTSGEFDFLTSLRMTARDGGVYVCGGSLVSPTKIITAAHCMYDEDGNEISYVSAALEDDGAKPYSHVRAADFTIHPNYNKRNEANDIAVLTFSQPFTGAPTVTLPTAAQAASLTSGGSSVTSAGWGRLSSGGSSPSTFKVADLTVIPDSVCGSTSGRYTVGGVTYKGIGSGYLSASMICAGGSTSTAQPIDTCQGDSGGPLVAGRGSSAVLVGVVSWGYGCAGMLDGDPAPYGMTPGVYTRLANYLPWLATQGIDSSSPGGDTVTRTVSGLSAGSYVFRVRALNDAGAGDWSATSNTVTVQSEASTKPSRPEYLDVAYRIRGRQATATVYWTWSSFDSMEPDSYRYRIRKAGKKWSGWKTVQPGVPEAKGVKVTKLAVGKRHRMQVQAVNSAGTSPSLTINLRPKR